MKNKYIAALLALLLGGFGAQYFYIGKPKRGLLCILLCLTPLPYLWGLYKAVLYVCYTDAEFAEECNIYFEEHLQKIEDSNYTKIEDAPQRIDENSDELYYLKGVNGQLYVYDNRIIIERKGFLGFVSHGLAGGKTIPIKNIVTLQYKEAGNMVNGFIQFGIRGAVEASAGIFNSVENENSVIFTNDNSSSAKEIKDFIESRIY